MTPRSSGSSSSSVRDGKEPKSSEPLVKVLNLSFVREETLARSDVFWGVDFSCSAASIGWCSDDRRGVITATWDGSLRGGERLQAARYSMLDKVRSLCKDQPGAFVYIEQPAGRLAPELLYMSGVLQEACHEGLSTWWSKSVDIRTVNPATWKKKVLGRGDYKKPGKKDDFEYEAILWCRRNAVEVADDNESDAVCIAEYARLVVRFA